MDSHCQPVDPLLESISDFFGSCIPSYLSLLSTILGALSIVSWLFAQMPQIWKNYRRKSVDGLSLGFLSIWLAGDICNLLGALWTDQMLFQQVVGGYYVFVDCILCGQYLYFGVLWRDYYHPVIVYDGTDAASTRSGYSSDDEYEEEDDSYKRKDRKHYRPTGRSRTLASTLIVMLSLMLRVAGASPVDTPLKPQATESSVLIAIGGVLSWFSTILYLSSRLPQLLLNMRRRSTSGLSITLFVAAFFGNFFYSASLLCNPLGYYDYPPYGGDGLAGRDGNDHLEWWGRTLPFFLGAAGVLALDAAVGWQYMLWGECEPAIEVLEVAPIRSTWVLRRPTKWFPWSSRWGSDSAEGKRLVTEVEETDRYGGVDRSR